MPIRARQLLPHCVSFGCFLTEVQTNEATGESELKSVNQADFVLPSSDMYDLQTLIKAGVDLKKVNTKILPSTGVNVSFEEDRKETETPKDGE